MSSEARINKTMENIPGEILSDLVGSSDFGKFMLQKMLTEILEKDWRDE
jgi:ABC-type antimicrobial peptide transport system ATPase subunit